MDNTNIAHTLTTVASERPDAVGLIEPRRSGYQQWTFREIDAYASACAHGLESIGITGQDRTVLMVRPSLDFICLAFALFRLGAPVILIDPGMGYRNLLRCISSIKPTAFIGIPRAQLFRMINYADFPAVSKSVCVGRSFGFLGTTLRSIADFSKGSYPVHETAEDELAAIIFTTGSTGPPKGVRYLHGNFMAQLTLIRDHYGITPDDIDQPAFPLFGLFSTAMGACAVIPDMDPARPARVDPELFVKSIRDHKVTYSFGSPAIWNVVSRYCLQKNIRLDSLRMVLMAGAPVAGELIGRVREIISEQGEIHTPYGATESLPVTSISGREVLSETLPLSRKGRGTCVGRPLPGIELKVIMSSDNPVNDWSEVIEMPPGEVGEIVVRGGVVTSSYENLPSENRLAKIKDGCTVWHRIGDLGYLDDENRLWFCGRKAHRVDSAEGLMLTIPCESLFNEHPAVLRSALVGVRLGGNPKDIPVLIVEPVKRSGRAQLLRELREIGRANPLTRNIEHYLIKYDFPVDIRHNAKIFREKLAVWAEKRIRVAP